MGFHLRLALPPTHPLRPVIPNNACHLCLTAAAGTELAVASSPGTVNFPKRKASSQSKEVYNPKAFFPHAALLRQAFAHCAKFLTAASRRRLARVSVPVCAVFLPYRLPIIALVGHYPTH